MRAECEWSQEARRASIEKGRYDPSLSLAFRLAETFGCRIEDFFTPDAGA
ncbi:helix-turn-helix transcriptional regulator [Actinomadura alba]|uniref:Transcriptional regulator n=1 Tax=Actinomadura alba TaxID=406431 RepID=A0ABR7LJK3_9ACTN|nr:transcriptional regulator [Actinomadura alba]MBC6464774.1 transcriptional regulator [Actinomadura alba]